MGSVSIVEFLAIGVDPTTRLRMRSGSSARKGFETRVDGLLATGVSQGTHGVKSGERGAFNEAEKTETREPRFKHNQQRYARAVGSAAMPRV